MNPNPETLVRGIMKEHGLQSYSHIVLLRELEVTETLTSTDISNRLQIKTAAVTGLVDKLANIELIDRVTDPDDRRKNRVTLTRKGREFLEDYHSFMNPPEEDEDDNPEDVALAT